MNLKWLSLKIYCYSKYSSYPQETVRIIKGGPGAGKNYLAPLKPKFLFLAFCLIQIQKTASVLSFLLTSNILTV